METEVGKQRTRITPAGEMRYKDILKQIEAEKGARQSISANTFIYKDCSQCGDMGCNYWSYCNSDYDIHFVRYALVSK